MRFYCQRRSEKNEDPCKQFAWRDEEYCRWHLVQHRLIDPPKPQHQLLNTLYLGLAVVCMVIGFWALWRFLLGANLDLLLSVFWYLGFSGWLFGLGKMFGRSFSTVWPKLYSISLAAVSAFFIGCAISGVASPASADFMIRIFYPNLDVPHPLFFTVTMAVIGVFFTVQFLWSVLFVPIGRRVYFLIAALYLAAWTTLIVLDRAPLWPMIWLVLCIVLWLWESNPKWFTRLLEVIRGWLQLRL